MRAVSRVFRFAAAPSPRPSPRVRGAGGEGLVHGGKGCRRVQSAARVFMLRHVPNLLTGSRLVLAAVLFVLLGLYQHEGRGGPWLLNIAFIIYLVALSTDFVGCYL